VIFKPNLVVLSETELAFFFSQVAANTYSLTVRLPVDDHGLDKNT